MTEQRTICLECDEEVELCIVCREIIHEDDPKALTGEGTFCQTCYKRDFRGGCTNRKMTNEIEGHPV